METKQLLEQEIRAKRAQLASRLKSAMNEMEDLKHRLDQDRPIYENTAHILESIMTSCKQIAVLESVLTEVVVNGGK